jgi:hypothetical protein
MSKQFFERYKKEIKPIINQYEGKVLGVCATGCRCHVAVLISVSDEGEWDIEADLSPVPIHRLHVSESWYNNSVEEHDGILYWKSYFGDNALYEVLHDESDGKVRGAIKEEGVWFVDEECSSFSEAVYEAIGEFIEESKLTKGTYKLLVETGCWTDYSYWDGYEGDSASNVILLQE